METAGPAGVSAKPTHRRRPKRASIARLGLGLAAALALLVTPSVGARPVAATFGGPDGRVVFSRGEVSGDQFRIDLFTMNPDGTGVRQITTPDWGEADTGKAWSPDGSRIAFERDSGGLADIYLVNPDGTGLTRLTDCASETQLPTQCGGYFGPTWTPDGRSLVLTRCCVQDAAGYSHQGIYTMRADGTGMRELTYSPDPAGGDDGPTVSPDGQWVAFSRQVTDINFSRHAQGAMFLVRLDGSGLHQITSYGLWVDEKDWSPDGSRIVFVTHAGNTPSTFRADIDTIRPDGSGLTQLTHTTPGATFAFNPVWAPGGDRIMFVYASDRNVIETMLPDGSSVQQVIARGFDPSWGTAAVP